MAGTWFKRIAPLAVVLVALLVGLFGLDQSGCLWPDGPRYANAGAMIRDWLRSGDLSRPYEFAQRNYVRYPAFNIPYHPPAYPAALGVFFSVFGVSYAAARTFIALCLAGCGLTFAGILRQLGARRFAAWTGALLLVSTPQVAHWSRSTMSEIPALLFVLLGTSLFLSWAHGGRAWRCWGAFGLAGLAFLSRVTSVGILPAWFAYLLFTERRKLLSFHLAAPTLLFLVSGGAWVHFVLKFSRYELRDNVSGARRFSLENLVYYPARLPEMVGWIVLVAAIIGAAWTVVHLVRRRPCRCGLFGASWFVAYLLFQWALAMHEPRYFTFALPGLVGLAACLLSKGASGTSRRTLVAVAVVAAFVLNGVRIADLPRGTVGYRALAERLAGCERPGNVLLATWCDQDLIFRFRARDPQPPRQMIRSDRTLTIRLSSYADWDEVRLAETEEEVIKVVRRGRVRYLVTCNSPPPWVQQGGHDLRIAHRVASSDGERFRLLDTYPLRVRFDKHALETVVFLWEYLGELPPGPSEISVPIPTADMDLPPH